MFFIAVDLGLFISPNQVKGVVCVHIANSCWEVDKLEMSCHTSEFVCPALAFSILISKQGVIGHEGP